MTEPPWMVTAQEELGQAEIAGADHNPRVVAYHQATSLKATNDETPWCASFANWCLTQSGENGTNSARARSFLKYGYAVALGKIRFGDIVILERGNRYQGHVGFVYAWNADHIQVLGGNQGDKVSLAWYPVGRLLGIRRP